MSKNSENATTKSEGKFMLLKLKIFALALLLINSVASANSTAEDFSLNKDECIILVASTKSETEARAIAKKYPGSELYTSKSGYIAVGLEKISKQQSAARIKELFAAEKIPKGSNCADNSRITGLLNVDSQKPEKQAKSKPEKREQKNDPTPADVDLFCSGMLTRASGLINENIGLFSGDDRSSFEQVSQHLSNNGMLLLQKGVLNGGDLENSNIGLRFANEKIGNNVIALSQDGSDQKKAIMGCLKRNN